MATKTRTRAVTVNLLRIHNETERTFTHGTTPLTEKEARQRVAWCCTDNLNMTQLDACAVAASLTLDGAPLTVGHYTFTATPTTTGETR